MRSVSAGLALLVASLFSAAAAAQVGVTATPPADGAIRITWEVKNRFRLFRNEADFQRHVAAHQGDGVLAAERRLARGSDGHGWARLTLNSLCVDAAGRTLDVCERDGTRESYIAPTEHRVGIRLVPPLPDATCAWNFESPDHVPQQATLRCDEEVTLRAPYGRPTLAAVTVTAADGSTQRATAELLVRDLLIAGIGDSVASGEGNPDRAVVLEDEGFCFRRFMGSTSDEYFRPSRAGFKGNKSCETVAGDLRSSRAWSRHGASWMSAACHRSLYSYQIRTALALAVEHPHVAITFVGLACSGAEIEAGLLGQRRARELTCGGRGRSGQCPATVPAQVGQMKAVLQAARRVDPSRTFDLVLLTIGANDIGFSELVANALLEDSAERTMMQGSGRITSVERAQAKLRTQLPSGFAHVRAALKPLVGGDLRRVVFVSYANPAMQGEDLPCQGGRDGVDIHPAFAVDPQRLAQTAAFVNRELLPRLRALVLCEEGTLCSADERMTLVDAHQAAFLRHGFCARAETDPTFDRECFSMRGDSFQRNNVVAIENPMACARSVREFRPYASRERWIRTPNDSYFAAMTYPDGLPSTILPADIHDATWGVLSAVYGGAIHPTAEGHAAMADAALPAARGVLGLDLGAPLADEPPAR